MIYDTIVFFGRFEPFHNGDLNTLNHLLDLAQRVIVFVGSAGLPRSPQHPWTFEERAAMIRQAMGSNADRVICRPVADHLYVEAAWLDEITRVVARTATGKMAAAGDPRLPWPQIETDVIAIDEQDLRARYFGKGAAAVRDFVPDSISDFLESFQHDAAFPDLHHEHDILAKYKQSWSSAPYPPIFTTVDTVAVCAGHVLMIQRKGMPGRGLWAFPGGFIEADEYLIDAARRELREETGLDISLPDFYNRVVKSHLFDYPQRSQRGRTISQGFRIDLDGPLLPVEGADDALQARWVPIADARTMRDRMFEDHFSILEYFIGL